VTGWGKAQGLAAAFGWRSTLVLGGMVALFYVNRLFPEFPLYASDEGAYLIRALFADEIAVYPELHRNLQPVGNSAYLLVIRALKALTLNVLPWLRLIGAVAYFGGLLLLLRAVSPRLPRPQMWGLAAVTLLFPYYRFVFSAMPEGLYVGLLCAIIVTTAWLYLRRPYAHALAVGALAAVLVLVKPHGLVAPLAFAFLVGVESLFSPQARRGAAQRLILFAIAFLATGAAIDLAAQGPEADPLLFFLGGAYSDHLGLEPPADGLWLAGLGLASMASVLALFAGPPVLAGLWSLAASARKILREGGTFRREDLVFLFALALTLGTVAMVAVFTYKIATIDGERYRLWGRYFECFVPILWLAAAPHLQPWRQGYRYAGCAAAGLALLGAMGLGAAFLSGVMLFPWDGTAVTAFFAPDPERWGFAPQAPFRVLAFIATAGLVSAAAIRRDLYRSWAVYFVVLGVLSTMFDDLWVGEIAQQRSDIEHELHVARGLMTAAPGPSVALVPNLNSAHLAYMRLNGGARILLAPPGKPPLADIEGYDWVIVMSGDVLDAPWQARFDGREVDVFQHEVDPRP